jgi:hypothetical protein
MGVCQRAGTSKNVMRHGNFVPASVLVCELKNKMSFKN